MNKRLTRAERRAATVSTKQGGATMGRAVRDSFQNVAAGLGIGTDNVSSGAAYGFNPISRNRIQLEFMYRGSWIAGRAVDAVADDMTRAGIDITSDIGPDDLEKIQVEFVRLKFHQSINETVKWARLYGGAIAVHLVDGQDPKTPLRPETVAKGQYRGLLVLDRWMVQPTLNQLVKTLGPDLGKPEFYDVTVTGMPLSGKRVHHSRVIRMDGDPLPYRQALAENGWGMSVLERVYDRLVAFDSTTQGAAQLVYKAHLRSVKVKNLRDILAAGGPAEAALTKQFQMIRTMQSNEGLTLLDADDDFQAFTYTFSGLSDVLTQFGQQLSGALKIPLVRLFGQSPAGLNSTGESDLRNYYDEVDQQRKDNLQTGYQAALEMIYRSVMGAAPSSGLSFTFNPLWQMSEREKAEIAVGVTGAVVQAVGEGLVSPAVALRELRQSADVTGVWSNITNEDIEEAEANPPGPETESEAENEPRSVEPDAAAASSPLNGAQISSIGEVSEQVAAGELSMQAGAEILRIGLGIEAEQAARIFSGVDQTKAAKNVAEEQATAP